MIAAGVLLLVWPLQCRRSIGRVHDRVAARSGDTDRFDRVMNGGWIRLALVGAPIAGVVLIVLGVGG